MHLYATHLAPTPRNMLHLSTERLAELADDTPTPMEARHLASCDACAHEREAYRSLVAMAQAEREPFGLPLTRWDAIAAELSAPPGASAAPELRTPRSSRWMLQIAAGLLLVAGGAMLGRLSTGEHALPGARTTASAAATSVKDSISTVTAASDSATFTSIDEARAAQQRSELLYQQAAAFLARVDTTGAGNGSPVAYRSRLAALDQMITTTREAMRDAPHDPVINGYYLTTMGQREATLRQLNTALPQFLRVNSF